MKEPTMYKLRCAEPTARTEELVVIVEVDQDGAARIRQCPPGVVVMVVQRSETGDEDGQEQLHRKRSVAAGRRDSPHCGPEAKTRSSTEVRGIPVEFPG